MHDMTVATLNALILWRDVGMPIHPTEEEAVPKSEGEDKILALRTPFLGTKVTQATPLLKCAFADLSLVLVDDPQEGGRA